MKAGICAVLLAFIGGLPLAATAVAQEAPIIRAAAQTVASFNVPEANQGIGVDDRFFYAVDNQAIAKYDKQSGARVAVWQGEENGPILHLNSAVLVDGLLYAAHSNYPDWPATSSVEIFDARTLRHVDSYSFGIDRGALTWLDYYQGSWWGAFANYSGLLNRNNSLTQMVRFDEQWRVVEAWVFPDEILERFGMMSNSGGSWGPDSRLYISGHDQAEVYVMELPQAGSVLRWVGTVPLDIAGQGIAWDRSQPDMLYGIVRAERRVTASRITVIPAPN